MLSPEAWHFEKLPSRSPDQGGQTSSGDGPASLAAALQKLPDFVDRVTIALPDTLHFPADIKDLMLSDTEFYAAEGLQQAILFSSEFVDTFLAEEELVLYTEPSDDPSKTDVMIDPEGNLSILFDSDLNHHLILPHMRLTRSKQNFRAVSRVNLRAASSKTLEALRSTFREHSVIQGRVLFSWRPSKSGICPSSLAKFFHDSGSKVSELCQEDSSRRITMGKYPLIDPDLDMERRDVFEAVENWLGASMLGIDPGVVFQDEEMESCKSTVIQEFSGTVHPSMLRELCAKLLDMAQSNDKPWIAVTLSFSGKTAVRGSSKMLPLVNEEIGYAILFGANYQYRIRCHSTKS